MFIGTTQSLRLHTVSTTQTSIMYTLTTIRTTLLAFLATVTATPFPSAPKVKTSVEKFQISVTNNCPGPKAIGLYHISQPTLGPWKITEYSPPVTLRPGRTQIMLAPFRETGMRLSGHAERGPDGQWEPQALFEFGYSTYAGREGTAYDLSVMEGSEMGVGISVVPGDKRCWSKKCIPEKCGPKEGWTRPEQVSVGSPADTVCYHGRTAFKVVFCPRGIV